jgi:hypothetical protein
MCGTVRREPRRLGLTKVESGDAEKDNLIALDVVEHARAHEDLVD